MTGEIQVYDGILANIAYHDGLLFSVWGPCSGMATGTQRDPCDCAQCSWANKLEADGLDYEDEFQKAWAELDANA